MSDQPLDLRKALRIVRRHKIQVGAVTALGCLLGTGYAVAKPPLYSSQALVVIPLATSAAGQAASTPGGLSSGTTTQVYVADSNRVLTGALPNIQPSLSLAELTNDVSVAGVTDSLIGFTGRAKTAAQAESIANAVANSYVAYVGSPAARAAACRRRYSSPLPPRRAASSGCRPPSTGWPACSPGPSSGSSAPCCAAAVTGDSGSATR